MRIKEDYEGQLTDMDQEKVELIRRLTDAIRELDSLNQEKGELNDKLITLFKFIRDVERQTLRSEDLMTVVDESLKEELKSEKQQGICLREQIKMLESERFRVRDKVIDTDCLQEQFKVDKSDMQRQLEMRHRDFEAVQKDYLETVTRLKAFQSEVDDLRSLCMTL